MNARVIAVIISIMLSIQGTAVLNTRAADGIISINAILKSMGGDNISTGLILLFALPMILFALYQHNIFVKFVILLPQVYIITICTIGVLDAAVRGSYADGVIRPSVFILIDQLPLLFLSIIHTASVAEIVWHDIRD